MANELKTIDRNVSPAELIEKAVAGNANLEQLKTLLELQKDWEANEARKAYHKAMANFKDNPPKINKDRKVKFEAKGGSVGYNHASLSNVVDKISKELSKYGLSASWKVHQTEQISVTCKITHELGHSEEVVITAPSDNSGAKNAIQAIGSTITYLQRYSLLSITGLATFEDDDAMSAGKEPEKIGEKELSVLRDLIVSAGIEKDASKFMKFMAVEQLEDILLVNFPKAKAALEAKVSKKGVK